MRTELNGSSLKREVRTLLRYGKEKARTGSELAKALGFKDDRLVRLAIKDLIDEGLPVASSVKPPHGYFIASSYQEAQEYMRVLHSRLVGNAYRLKGFKQASRDILQPHQMALI